MITYWIKIIYSNRFIKEETTKNKLSAVYH